MKKFSFILTAVLALLLLASCSKKQGSRLIPDNALVVGRFDLLATLEKSGMRGDDTSLKDELMNAIKHSGLDKEAREKVMEIIDDPTSVGIDFTEPVYFYASVGDGNSFEGGLVGAMASKGDLTDVLKLVEDASEGEVSVEEYDSDGVMYVMIDRFAALIFNGDWFYMGSVQRDGYEADIDATIEALLDRAAGNGNIEENEAFQALNERQGLLQLGFFGSGLEGIRDAGKLNDMLPDGLELSGLAGVLNLAINDGEVLLEGEMLPLSEEWKEKIKESAEKLNPITEDLAKYVPEDGSLLLLDIDPEGIFDNIRDAAKASGARDGDLRQLDEIESLLKSFTGRAVAYVGDWSEDADPEVVGYVETRNSDLVDKIMESRSEDEGITREGANKYLIPIDYDYDYVDSIGDWAMIPTKFMKTGWDNDMTYFMLNSDSEPFTKARRPFTDVQGMGMFARVNGKMIGQLLASASYRFSEIGNVVDDLIDYAELYNESGTKGVFRLAMKKKDQSPIITVVDYVKRKLR